MRVGVVHDTADADLAQVVPTRPSEVPDDVVAIEHGPPAAVDPSREGLRADDDPVRDPLPISGVPAVGVVVAGDVECCEGLRSLAGHDVRPDGSADVATGQGFVECAIDIDGHQQVDAIRDRSGGVQPADGLSQSAHTAMISSHLFLQRVGIRV